MCVTTRTETYLYKGNYRQKKTKTEAEKNEDFLKNEMKTVENEDGQWTK